MERALVVIDFKSVFNEWKKENPCEIYLNKIDFVSRTISLRVGSQLQGKLEISFNDDGSYFASEAPPDFSDLNSFLLSQKKLSFPEVLSKLFSLSKQSSALASSFGSLSGSYGYSAELEEEDNWHTSVKEKQQLMEHLELAKMKLGEDIKLMDDLACIVMKLDPSICFNEALAQTLDISLSEPLFISLSYASNVYPSVKVTQYGKERSFGVRVFMKSVVEHFVNKSKRNELDKIYPKEQIGLKDADTDIPPADKWTAENMKKIFTQKPLEKTERQDKHGSTKKVKVDDVKADMKCVELIVNMGFARRQAILALEKTKNNVDDAVNWIIMNPDEDVPEIEAKNHEEIDDSVFASNYFVELADFVRYRFQNMHCFCMACHEPHRCGMSKDKDDGSPNLPIICGKDLCVFAFEEQKFGEMMQCRLCPQENCNEEDGIDSSLALCQALKSNGGAFGISLNTLLEMHRHRYLPIASLLKLHEAVAAVNYQIVKIESILNPPLCLRFEKKWKEMKETNPDVHPELAYHGSAEKNIPSIQKNGLLVPGKDYGGDIGEIGHATDTGFWGKGIYLSPNSSMSIGYCRGGSVLLVNAVLMGKIFKCTELIHGQPKREGYDSHQDPSGQEWIIFDEAQVLPCYSLKIAPKNQPVQPYKN